MGKAWRIVLYIAAGLLVVGFVLLGAAWLTGASIVRIEELVLSGKGGLNVWLQNGVDSVLAFLRNAAETVKSFF